MREVMEVNGRAGKHPHPNNQNEVQGNVEGVENHPGQGGVAHRYHGPHGGHLLHD